MYKWNEIKNHPPKDPKNPGFSVQVFGKRSNPGEPYCVCIFYFKDYSWWDVYNFDWELIDLVAWLLPEDHFAPDEIEEIKDLAQTALECHCRGDYRQVDNIRTEPVDRFDMDSNWVSKLQNILIKCEPN